jgi:hypothetical protein
MKQNHWLEHVLNDILCLPVDVKIKRKYTVWFRITSKPFSLCEWTNRWIKISIPQPIQDCFTPSLFSQPNYHMDGLTSSYNYKQTINLYTHLQVTKQNKNYQTPTQQQYEYLSTFNQYYEYIYQHSTTIWELIINFAVILKQIFTDNIGLIYRGILCWIKSVFCDIIIGQNKHMSKYIVRSFKLFTLSN